MRWYISVRGLAAILLLFSCQQILAQASGTPDPTSVVSDDALRQDFGRYYYGWDVPKNERLAEQYLNEAASLGSEWAILLVAQKQEKSAPEKALDAYLRLARHNNCIAQMRLANAYASGQLVQRNLTQAYFWLLLAKVDNAGPNGRMADVEYNDARGITYSRYKDFCFTNFSTLELQLKIEAHKLLPPNLVRVAQDAATNWSEGSVEKLLPAPPGTPTVASNAKPQSVRSTKPISDPPNTTASVSNGVSEGQSQSESQSQTASNNGESIPLSVQGGTFIIPVLINGQMTLNFTIDSGAADVSIPADVVSRLIRTGTLQESDFLGKKTYRLADGSTVPSVTFVIRSLKVGNHVLENVTASVLSSAQADLLLGQTFLSRFNSWSIDNKRQVLLLN